MDTNDVLSDADASRRHATAEKPLPAIGAVRDRVSRWAAEWEVTDDPYVVACVSATDVATLDALVGLDPLEALPHPEGTDGRGLRRLSNLLQLVRNLAIFVPVALTWLGIRQASEAFGKYTAAETTGLAEQLSFLQFWQAGGPPGGPTYLTAGWRIQSIALSAALIVFAIVGLTLIIAGLNAASGRRERRRQVVAEQKRTAVAVELVRGVGVARSTDTSPLSAELVATVESLVAASTLVATASDRLDRASAGLGDAAPRLDELGRRFEQLGTQVGDVAAAVDRFGRSVATLSSRVDSDVAGMLEDTVAGLDEVRAQLARTSASVEFGTKQLRDDLDAIHAGLATAGAGSA